MIYDFFGFDATTKNPFEKMGTYIWNFAWMTVNRIPWVEDLSLFVGNAEDIAEKSYGVFLPNAKKHAEKHYQFLGNILPFNPEELYDTSGMKRRLGYWDRTSHCMCCRWNGHRSGPFKSMFPYLQDTKG